MLEPGVDEAQVRDYDNSDDQWQDKVFARPIFKAPVVSDDDVEADVLVVPARKRVKTTHKIADDKKINAAASESETCGGNSDSRNLGDEEHEEGVE
jgi:hypothetical protein